MVERTNERTSEEVKECYRDKGFACFLARSLPLSSSALSLSSSLFSDRRRRRRPLYTPWYMRELLWRMDFCTVTYIAPKYAEAALGVDNALEKRDDDCSRSGICFT